jgi:hypothetical protein
VKKEADEYKCKIIISIWTPEQKKKKNILYCLRNICWIIVLEKQISLRNKNEKKTTF